MAEMKKVMPPYSDKKILMHPEKIKDLLDGKRTAPIYVRLKPTNVCNQRCYYCGYADDQVFDSRKVDRRESIPWEKMQELISDFKEMGVKAVTFSGGGEPLVYHSIIPTLKLIKDSGIDYAMITNAQELKGEKAELLAEAKWIRVSMDATNTEDYQKIRQVSTYDMVVENVANFAKIKNEKCELGINFVVTNDSYLHIYDFCVKMKAIGVNNIKFSPLMINGDSAEYHSYIRKSVEEQLKSAKMELTAERFHIIDKYTGDMLLEENFQKAYRKCYICQLFTVVAADQKVYLCHQRAYMPEGYIGDISDKSFKDLWFSEDTTKRLEEMDASENCPFRCAFEERNVLLNDIMSGKNNPHINFI